jgi:type II secretory pathway pseudopilin PulG
MRREAGFSMLEMLIAAAVMVIIVGVTLSALTQAIHATEAVTLMADAQDNLRAGLNWMVRDISQAGDGIPQGGITIPNSGGASATSKVLWPGTGGNFPSAWTQLPPVAPGFELGVTTNTSGQKTDMITVMYADNTLQDNTFNPPHWLNEFPISLAATATAPGCPNGKIVTVASTTTVTFDGTNCIHIAGSANTGLNVGDLILLQNNTSACSADNSVVASMSCDSNSIGNPTTDMALMYVSAVSTAANTITFSPGDPFGLNASGQPAGTLASMGGGTTTATRVWMITYYINNANPLKPQLMRQVNANAAEPVSDSIENLQIFYDIVNAGTSPATVTAEVEGPTQAQLGYIRDAYILLCARSSSTYSQDRQYFRNNLETVVNIRGLNYFNQFN